MNWVCIWCTRLHSLGWNILPRRLYNQRVQWSTESLKNVVQDYSCHSEQTSDKVPKAHRGSAYGSCVYKFARTFSTRVTLGDAGIGCTMIIPDAKKSISQSQSFAINARCSGNFCATHLRRRTSTGQAIQPGARRLSCQIRSHQVMVVEGTQWMVTLWRRR